MKLTKKFFFGTRPRQLIFCAGVLFILFIFYLLLLFLSVSRPEIALAKLKKSYQEERICHEECHFWRQAQEKIIVSELRDGSKKLNKIILNDWRDPALNFDFKKELLIIIASVYGVENPPGYLQDYLVDTNSEKRLVREIITRFNFSSASSQNLAIILHNKIKTATSSQEKIQVLEILAEINNDQEIDNYFFLLSSNDSVDLKREVIKNISLIHEKSSVFTLAQLESIKNLILTPAIDLRLRQDLVLLVGDYYLVFPKESEAVWQEVYTDKSLDNISRAFSADNLNHLAGQRLILPAVSPLEWANYYNQ